VREKKYISGVVEEVIDVKKVSPEEALAGEVHGVDVGREDGT
jgi:hypothetical protein